MESHWKVGLLLKSRQLRKKKKDITRFCQLQGSFGRTGSQARRAALGHGRWRLWFTPTYEGNTSMSIPRNMRMTMQGMLKPDSNPGMEPKLYLLQPTTKYHSIISHEVSTLLAVQLHRRSVFCTLCKTFTLLAAPFSSWQLKLCLIQRGQSIEQLKEKKRRMRSEKSSIRISQERQRPPPTATVYRTTRHALTDLGHEVSNRGKEDTCDFLSFQTCVDVDLHW